MPRIIGVDIPKEKRIEIALTYLFGVGRFLANKILQEANISSTSSPLRYLGKADCPSGRCEELPRRVPADIHPWPQGIGKKLLAR